MSLCFILLIGSKALGVVSSSHLPRKEPFPPCRKASTVREIMSCTENRAVRFALARGSNTGSKVGRVICRMFDLTVMDDGD